MFTSIDTVKDFKGYGFSGPTSDEIVRPVYTHLSDFNGVETADLFNHTGMLEGGIE